MLDTYTMLKKLQLRLNDKFFCNWIIFILKNINLLYLKYILYKKFSLHIIIIIFIKM